ncbi:hypothetical protein [Candidatus Nitrospira bockiana]
MMQAVPLLVGLVTIVTAGSPQAGTDLVQDRPYESVTESERLYDPDAAETIRGVVEAVETVRLEDGAPFMQVRLRTEDEAVRVHLAPEWFMQEQINRLEIDVGRELEVRGSKHVVKGEPVFVAAEVQNDGRDQRLRLRHPDGTPVWTSGERAG